MSIAQHPDFASGAYDELSFWSSRFGALLIDRLELRAGIVGLDIACGTGFPLFELAHAHGATSRFVGVDVWVDGLVRARRKLNVFASPHVTLCAGDAATLPFPDSTFDLVVSNLGINNFEDPPAALAELHRVTRGGGRIAVTTNLAGHMDAFYGEFRRALRDEGRDDLLPALDEQEAHRGTRTTIEQLLTHAGFALTQVVEDEFFLSFVNATAMFAHPLVGFFKGGWESVTRDAAVYRRIEERLNAVSPLRMRIPMLYAEGVRR